MGKETSGWNQRNQDLAKAWGKQALILKWLHYQASMFYQKVDRWLGIPTFFLLSAMGTALVGSAATDNEELSEIITWISAGISFLTAGLIGALFYLDPSTLSQRHLQKSTYFDDAYHDIQLELSMDPEVRQNAGWFLQFVQRKLALAQNLPPIVPQRFWSQRPMDIVHGHLAQDLRELDKYFTNVLGSSLQHPAPIPKTLHEVMSKDTRHACPPQGLEDLVEDYHSSARKENKEDMVVLDLEDQEHARKENKEDMVVLDLEEDQDQRPSCNRGRDSSHIHSPFGDAEAGRPEDQQEEDVFEEENDYINRLVLQDELQKEMHRIRQEHKQRRYEYQMQRYLHSDVKPISMKPPDLENGI